MKLYEFSAKDYGDQIKKVYLAHLDLRGIWQEDVADRAVAVGIWPNRSGWGFGWVDLLQLKAGALWQGRYCEVDEEGNPLIKRRYGLVKLEWKEGALQKEKMRVWIAEVRSVLKKEKDLEAERLMKKLILKEVDSAVTQEDIDKLVERWGSAWKGVEEDGG